MLTVIVSSISIVLVITSAIVLYRQNEKLKIDTRDKMQGLVDQINDAQYYEYKFDQKQDQNIKNVDANVSSVHQNLIKLQNNVKFLEKNASIADNLKKKFDTKELDASQINADKLRLANGTTRNNIVFEAGRTSDGNNEGWSAINFNGYYKDGEKRIDQTKGRWRMISEQRGGNDAMGFDHIDKNNSWWNYMWMTDGTVGINNNKLRFSNRWTGFPDNARDQAEISNDANGFKKLMIVGNKASGEGIRKVGIWDRLDVHGNQGVDGWMSAQNTQGRDHVVAGNWNAWMRNDGYIYGSSWVDGQNVKARENVCVRDVCMNRDEFAKAKNGNSATGGGNRFNEPVWINQPIYHMRGDPGPMVERNYGQDADRYGMGQFSSGATRLYAATAYPGTVNLSFAQGGNNFYDALRVYNQRGIYTTKVDALQLGDKWTLSGRGDGHANDGWLRLMNTNRDNYNGGFAAGELWTGRGGVVTASDIRMKRDVANVSKDDIDKLTNLAPKQYVYKEDPKNRLQYGLIAQDVEKIYPNLVETGPNGMKSMRYNDLIPLLVGKIKDMENKACVDGVCLTKEDILKLKSL